MSKNQDILLRGTALNNRVRVFASLSTSLVEELRRRHESTPTATAALGRTVTAAAMMGMMLKGQEKLTVQVKGGGPIGQIVADANANGEARGYVTDPTVDLPLNQKGKLDVAGAVGTDGALYVTKDLGLKEPYRGTSPIVSGELAEDFTYYFGVSEQTPSAVALGVLVDVDYTVKAAGGFIIQLLPGLRDEEITEIEQKLSELPSVTSLIDQGLGPKEILERLFEDVKIMDAIPLVFRCSCSQERVEKTLISLGKEELEGLIQDLGRAEVACHFCNEKYVVEKDELERMSAEFFI
jgi:molecular chaperone Hsp33